MWVILWDTLKRRETVKRHWFFGNCNAGLYYRKIRAHRHTHTSMYLERERERWTDAEKNIER